MMIISFIVMLAMLLIPVFIIVAVIKIVIKKDPENESADFGNIIRTIYVYLVIIISLFIIIYGIITLFSGFIDILLPVSEESSDMIYEGQDINSYEEPDMYSDDNKSAMYKKQNMYINQNMIKIMNGVGAVLIGLPVFTYHTKQANKLK